MATLSENKAKALPLNAFMAQYLKGMRPKKRASEALDEYKRKHDDSRAKT
jgi:hypothetical protein